MSADLESKKVNFLSCFKKVWTSNYVVRMFGICLFSCRIEAPDKKAAFVWCLTLHLPHPVRLFSSLPRRRSFGSSRSPLQRTTFVGQERVTNPKERVRGSRRGGGGYLFWSSCWLWKCWVWRNLFVKEQLAIIEFGFRRIWRILQIEEGVIGQGG